MENRLRNKPMTLLKLFSFKEETSNQSVLSEADQRNGKVGRSVILKSYIISNSPMLINFKIKVLSLTSMLFTKKTAHSCK